MNFQKIAFTGATAALLLSSVAPAFAFGSDVNVNNTFTNVKNEVSVKSNSGFNEVKTLFGKGGFISTGDALAGAEASNVVNTTTAGISFGTDVDVDNTFTYVKNDVSVKSTSGFNEIKTTFGKGGFISTGGALSEGVVANVVNTTVVN